MKTKIFTVISIAFLLAFASVGCSKDEGLTQNQILGKWYLSEVWDKSNNKWVSTAGTTLANEYSEFKSDGTYKSASGKYLTVYTGTYTLDGDVVVCKVGTVTVRYYIIGVDANTITFDLQEYDGANKQRLKGKRQ